MPNSLREQSHTPHGAQQPLRNAEPLEELGVGKVNGQFPVTGPENVLAELGLVARENLDAFASARDGHVPLLTVRGRLDGGIREQDVINGFAL